ncbi:MAG: hypothetical protein AB7G25_04190 [Sphingomonadaceae bacterium]
MVLTLAMAVALSGCATGVEKGLAAYNQGSFDQAAVEWNGPALRGDPVAQHNLGLLWEHGYGSTPKNLNEAANWYLRAAQQGFVMAMVALARVQLAMNNRVPGDCQEFRVWAGG